MRNRRTTWRMVAAVVLCWVASSLMRSASMPSLPSTVLISASLTHRPISAASACSSAQATSSLVTMPAFSGRVCSSWISWAACIRSPWRTAWPLT